MKVHRCGTDQIAGEDQYRSNEECDLNGATQRDAHAQVQLVLARRGKRRDHFGGPAHQGHDDNSDKGRRDPKRDRGLLHGLDKHFTDERNEHCHYGEGCQGQ